MSNFDLFSSMFLTVLWASLCVAGMIHHSERLVLAGLAALSWNVGVDLGMLIRERRKRREQPKGVT